MAFNEKGQWLQNVTSHHRDSTPSEVTSSLVCLNSPQVDGQLVIIIHFSIPSLLPSFPLLVIQLHFGVDWLPMIGARQPSRLDYRSLLTAAYPTRGRSKHNES